MEPTPRNRSPVRKDGGAATVPGKAPAVPPSSGARMGAPGTGQLPPPRAAVPGQALNTRNVFAGPHFLALGRAVVASVGDAQAAVRVLSKIASALEDALRRPAPPDAESAPRSRVVLDLMRLFSADAACLSVEVGRCLDQLVTEQGLVLAGVSLPPRMDHLPPALGAMPRLSRVQLVDFQGTAIDTRELRPDGGAVEVRVLAAPRLVTLRRRPRHEVRVQGNSYLRIRDEVTPWPGSAPAAGPRLRGRADGKRPLTDPETGPAPGKLERRFYARVDRTDHADDAAYLADHAATLSRDLNFAATFTGTQDPIVCRHLALAVLYERLQWEAGSRDRRPREGRFDFSKFSTPQAIAQTIGSEWEGIYQRLSRGSRFNHLVALPRMGEFLDRQFGRMRVGESRYYLYSSVHHMMTLRIRLKDRPGVGPVRVVAVYDPNSTVTHFRQVVSGTGPLAFDFAQAMGPSGHALLLHYFERDPKGWIALLQDVTLADFEEARSGRLPAQAAGSPRELDAAFLVGGNGARLTPPEVVLRSHASYLYGLEPALVASLAQLRPGAGRLALLRGEGEWGKNALTSAWVAGHHDWVRAVRGAAVRAKLTREERIALLQGPTGPSGPMGMAGPAAPNIPLVSLLCSVEALDGIDLYCETMRVLALDAEARTSLLGSQDGLGFTPLDYAMARSPQTTARFVKAVLALDGDGFDCLSVLAASPPGRQGTLTGAVTHGFKDVVGEFARVVLESGLGDIRIRRILVPEDGARFREQLDGQPETAAALFAQLDASTQFQVSLELAASSVDPGERSSAGRLLAPYSGWADLSRLRGSQDPAEVRRFIASLHAILRTGLSLDDKVELLKFEDNLGRPLLYRLMAINAHQHVEALAKAMRCFDFNEDWDALFEARAPEEGLSAFSHALKEGNLLAIQAWMRQVLVTFQATARPEVERECVLLGLPPGASDRDRARAVGELRAATFTLGGWAREVASATPLQLAPETKRRLLALAGREDLLRGRDVKATQAPAPGRSPGTGR